MVIRGCNNTGVDVRVDATGAYTAPAVLTNITLTGNTGVQGAAMFIGPATSVVLQGVNIKANTAPQGVVYAAERSGLTLLNCSLSDNNGSAVVFAGSSLNITSSSFHNNTAAQTPVVAPSAHRSRNYSAGGALRLVCYERGPGGYDSVTVITNCSFHNNTGIRGGAIYAGAGTTLQLQAVDFLGNTALDGGAVFADRDSCLATHVNSSFLANSAQDR
jgi:predicted outer membrane repeat protein